MMGMVNKQQSFSDMVDWRGRIPEDHYAWEIEKWARENLSADMFAPLFAQSGRPSVPPTTTFRALLFQQKMGLSDRGLESASKFDDRVRLALGVDRDFAGLDAVTLCDHRERFFRSGIGNEIFNKVLKSAVESGLLSENHKDTIDSFMTQGAASIQDTYTMIHYAVRRVLLVAGWSGVRGEIESVLERSDYDTKAKPKINGDDPEEKRRLLESLVRDARRLVERVRELPQISEELAQQVNILEQAAKQDAIIDDTGRVEMV